MTKFLFYIIMKKVETQVIYEEDNMENNQNNQNFTEIPQQPYQTAQPTQVIYQQPVQYAPVRQLDTKRGLLKYILLSLVTFGIYGIVVMSTVGEDLNLIASRYDGKKTMHYCLMCFLITPITLGIGSLVWFHKMSDRIGSELRRRNINYSFGSGTFWGWNVLGSLIIVGPFIYMAKLFESMNQLSRSYNMYG